MTDEVYKEAIANGSCNLPITLADCRDKLLKELLTANGHYAVTQRSTSSLAGEEIGQIPTGTFYFGDRRHVVSGSFEGKKGWVSSEYIKK